jgi:hypothetical protein
MGRIGRFVKDPAGARSLAAILLVAALLSGACRAPTPPRKVRQRSELVVAPGLTVHVGDIHQVRGSAIVTVVGPRGAQIAEKEAHPGDVIPFESDGQRWQVEVVRFENHLLHDDYAYIRVQRR